MCINNAVYLTQILTPVLVQVLRMTRVRTFLQVNILISLPMLIDSRHFWNILLSIDFNLLPQVFLGCPKAADSTEPPDPDLVSYILWPPVKWSYFDFGKILMVEDFLIICNIVTTRLPTSSCWCPSWTRASTTSSSSPSRCTTSPAALLGLGEQADKPTLKARSGPNFVG